MSLNNELKLQISKHYKLHQHMEIKQHIPTWPIEEIKRESKTFMKINENDNTV